MSRVGSAGASLAELVAAGGAHREADARSAATVSTPPPDTAPPRPSSPPSDVPRVSSKNRLPRVDSPGGGLAAAGAISSSPADGTLTVVLKVGSSSLASASGQHPNLSAMCALVECVCALRRAGHRVVLVSSGAVAFGCQRMHLKARPSDLHTKQAIAAIGQGRLIKMYDEVRRDDRMESAG